MRIGNLLLIVIGKNVPQQKSIRMVSVEMFQCLQFGVGKQILMLCKLSCGTEYIDEFYIICNFIILLYFIFNDVNGMQI